MNTAYETLNVEELLSIISNLEATVTELKRKVETDQMTGCLNRATGDLKLTEAVRNCFSGMRHNDFFSLILLDIDHFKAVNDTYGHPVGDQVIKALAEVLRTGIREEDMVARMGGEEFMIILPKTHAKEAIDIIERIMARFKDITFWGTGDHKGTSFNKTISAGVVTYLGQYLSATEVYEQVDQALYDSKSGGRDRYTYKPLKVTL